MKEESYVVMLDTLTWTVVGLLALYIILWVIENYDVKSIDLNKEDNEIVDIGISLAIPTQSSTQDNNKNQSGKKSKGKKQNK